MFITEKLPNLIYAEAFIHSKHSISNREQAITADMLADFSPEPQLIQTAIEQLQQAGFEVHTDQSINPKMLTIAAPPTVYENVFKIKLTVVLQKDEAGQVVGKQVRHSNNLQWIDAAASAFNQCLEGILLSDPVTHFSTFPFPFPPPTSNWCLHVPGDVAIAMNAARAHRAGFTGKAIKVVMVDSGWYPHPFFSRHGYHGKVVLGPNAKEIDYEGGKAFQDQSGHGTGESANLFAVAPDIEFTMVKYSGEMALASLKKAISLQPDVISCSWGKSLPILQGNDLNEIRSYELVIAEAVHRGIIVVFSAGNLVDQQGFRLGQWAFPGQHPDVIAAGGAFMYPDERITATQFASGFVSNIYPGRVVPDVCGLVGLPSVAEPSLGGLYLMLPVEPGCALDRMLATDAPMTDLTKPDDGWAVFSGTSAAAPQIAGICALMKQAYPQLSPVQAKDILKRTARDVVTGASASMMPSMGGGSYPQGGVGYKASLGADAATGFGLADAARAVLIARLYYLADTTSLDANVLALVNAFKQGENLSAADWERLEDGV